MQFKYQPLTLGVPRTCAAEPRDRPSKSTPSPPRHETWREGPNGPKPDYEPHPEAQVLDRLRQAGPHHHPKLWVVLGEPGAGKSRLLEEWFRRWASESGEPRLGLCVPVLVRLRSLTAEDIRLDGEGLADRLWTRGVEERSRLDQSANAIYRAEAGRLYRPVWLLDGLDEVMPAVLGPDLPRKLAALPGVKVVSCRTAVFQTLRDSTAAYQEAEYAILGLTPDQQQAFLDRLLGNAEQAAKLAKQIRGNVQLAGLAGTPLMLGMIAEIRDEGPLPASRAEFYRRGAARLWKGARVRHRRLAGQVEHEELRSQRDPVLIALAGRMGLKPIPAPLDLLDEAIRTEGADPALRKALQHSGLVVINEDDETVAFVHLTFQEFYLACSLKSAGLRPVLEQYWVDVRYEETLGLLISLLAAERQYSEIADGLGWLVDWGRQIHQANPERLWRLGRSPLRVALHLVRRAGIKLEELGLISSRLIEEAIQSDLSRIAVASDADAPAEVLAALARDPAETVRRLVAENRTAPAEALAALARDPAETVRLGVAQNPAAPAEVLTALARDPDEELAALVRDRAEGVALNPAAPAEALAVLARNRFELLLSRPWWDPAVSAEALAVLARNPDNGVRRWVARNRTAPAEALAALARDPDEWARSAVAYNPAAPAEALAALARDPTEEVRRGVAQNRTAPAEALAALARDPDEWARSTVAQNPAAPAEVLAALARDPTEGVRGGWPRTRRRRPRCWARSPATRTAGCAGGSL